MSAEKISNEVAALYDNNPANLIAMLQEIQSRNKNRYLPRPELEALAACLKISVAKVYRIATFFKAFSLTPKGDYIIKVCLGTACHVRGGPRILEALERELGIKAGNTTSDGKFSLEAVRCLGACALGPILMINEEPHAYMTPDKATKLIAQLTAGEVERAEAPPKALPARAPVDLSGVPPAG